MRARYILIALFIVPAAFLLDCNGGGSNPSAPGSGASLLSAENGPCADAALVGDGVAVAACGPVDTVWAGGGNVLGPPDGKFTSLCGAAGSYVIIETSVDVVDQPGADLVVFEVQTGDNGDDDYDVFLSDNADSNFHVVANVGTEGAYCIDIMNTGISRGRYVKIVQVNDIDFADTLGVCDGTLGADIDAVGVINTDFDDDDICEIVGREVDEICDPEADYRNHGAYVSCVAHMATERLKRWKLTEAQHEYIHGCIVSQRAQTDIGKKPR